MARVLDKLYEIAEGQDGFFSTRQAANFGVTKQAIVQAERRGQVNRFHRGVYRLARFPYNGQTAQLWEAVLWPHVRTETPAVLSHETALRLHELSDVNPDQVHITLPFGFRVQRQPPQWLRLHRGDTPDQDVELIDGLPVTRLVRTFHDLMAEPGGNTAVLADAVRDAQQRGIRLPDEIRDRFE